MRTYTAVIAIVIGCGSVNAIEWSEFQGRDAQQQTAQQVVVLTVQGVT